MKYIYTHEGRTLAVGDRVGEYEITNFMDGELVQTKEQLPLSLWHSSIHSRWTECSNLGIAVTVIPVSGIFNRVSGERIVLPPGSDYPALPDGSRLEGFDQGSRNIYTAIRLPGAAWPTNDTNAAFLTERGIEVRNDMSEEILNHVPRFMRKGVVCIKVGRSFVPAEQAVWSRGEKKYIRLDGAIEVGDSWYPPTSKKLIQFLDGSFGVTGSGYEITGGPNAGRFVRNRRERAMCGGYYYPTSELIPIWGWGDTPESHRLAPPDPSDNYYELIDGDWCVRACIVTLGDGTRCGGHKTTRVMSAYRAETGRVWSRVRNSTLSEEADLCSDCGHWVLKSLMSGGICVYCAEHNRIRIRNYSNDTANYLVSEEDIPIKFGIELEVGTDKGYSEEHCAAVMADALTEKQDFAKYGIFKYDGSINCGGFEIVTRPDSPAVHKRIWTKALAEPKVRERMSSWSNGYCGMHIHVSRAPLSALWIGRILVVINSPDMAPLVTSVAGRGSVRYAKRIDKRLTSGKSRYGDRYEAVNTTGDNTIEFRIFRGTLDPGGFIRNVEFVEAVLAFTRPAETGLTNIGKLGAFLNFVEKSRKSYPALYAFLIRKGFVSDPRKPAAPVAEDVVPTTRWVGKSTGASYVYTGPYGVY